MSIQRILFIRLDRIGDLILTLPVDQLSFLKKADCTWVIPDGLEFVPECTWPDRKWQTLNKKNQWESFHKLLAFLRETSFDAAVVFHAPWWVSFALWLAKVPLRIGVKSQWHSFLFLNRTIRQKRSRAEMNEFDYNRKLVVEGFQKADEKDLHSLILKAPPAESLMSSFGLESKNYIVVHPGMGGSARNWPHSLYSEFIQKAAAHTPVVITGTSIDREWIMPLKEMLSETKNLIWLDEKLKPREWLAVLGASRGVLAPSTGTVHVAASLGIPTVGIYSPVRVQAPKRWGPLGPKVKVAVPEVDCPGEMQCLGPACPYFDCMTRITPEQVQAELENLQVMK